MFYCESDTHIYRADIGTRTSNSSRSPNCTFLCSNIERYAQIAVHFYFDGLATAAAIAAAITIVQLQCTPFPKWKCVRMKVNKNKTDDMYIDIFVVDEPNARCLTLTLVRCFSLSVCRACHHKELELRFYDFISCNSISDYVDVAHVSGVYFYVCMRCCYWY